MQIMLIVREEINGPIPAGATNDDRLKALNGYHRFFLTVANNTDNYDILEQFDKIRPKHIRHIESIEIFKLGL